MEANGSLPEYSQPSTHLGGQPFHLEGVNFTPPSVMPGAAKRAATYASWQVGTAYAVPFVFDPLNKHQLRVLLPPQDRDDWWMFGGEVEAGERLGDMLVQCIATQAGIAVEDERRTRFLDLKQVWDLMRMITVDEHKPPVPRHELARVFGYAMAPSEMADVRIFHNKMDPAGRWVDILSEGGIEFVKAEMDPALQNILGRLASCVLEFHGIKHG